MKVSTVRLDIDHQTLDAPPAPAPSLAPLGPVIQRIEHANAAPSFYSDSDAHLIVRLSKIGDMPQPARVVLPRLPHADRHNDQVEPALSAAARAWLTENAGAWPGLLSARLAIRVHGPSAHERAAALAGAPAHTV